MVERTVYKRQPLAKNKVISSQNQSAGASVMQTPASGPSLPINPRKRRIQKTSVKSEGFLRDLIPLRWVVVPSSSLKLLIIIVSLWTGWEILASSLSFSTSNPFAPLLFVSHRVATSSLDDSRYQKGYLDLVFIAFYIVVWSFIRQSITIWGFKPLARWYGIRKEGKLDRFGEQGYAVAYFAFTGFWGLRIMSQEPTWYYRTEHFWLDYPYWDMKPELKAYYLVQAAYWIQQLLVLVLGLEKPRKDYNELVAHHAVTLWLVGWSYLINLTRIGNAVYVSMDVPDAFLAFSKLLNYLQFQRGKVVSFAIFLPIWTYYRHYLNIVMLWSVWSQFDLMPESSKRWAPADGVWMVWWMKWQIFVPLFLLQILNLWWYYHFILKIAVNAIRDFRNATDTRSDDEGEEEAEEEKED